MEPRKCGQEAGGEATQARAQESVLDREKSTIGGSEMGVMGFSNSEALAVLKWMVRTRLLESLCEADPQAAFDTRIRDDFAELMEAGVITYGEVAHGANGVVSVRMDRDEDCFVFGATVLEGRIEIERRAVCI
jgi:hypothetical protein